MPKIFRNMRESHLQPARASIGQVVHLKVAPSTTQASRQKFHGGRFQWSGNSVRCALGETGMRALKKEGDRSTPMGTWRLIGAFFRADRMPRPFCRLPLRAIQKNWGWCDDKTSCAYNRFVKLPCRSSHETLWREDRLYDLIIVMDYNFKFRVKNRGSAIFLHCAAPGLSPTKGCIALEKNDFRRLLPRLSARAEITVSR